MGGSKTQIQQADAPNVQESSENLYQARLKYDPLTAAQEIGLQEQFLPRQTALQTALVQKYYPELSQLYTNVQAQQMPQLQALQKSLYPQQSQILEQGAGNVLRGLQSSDYGQIQEQSLANALLNLQQPYTPLQQALSREAVAQLQSGYGLSPEQYAAQEAFRNREFARTQMLARGRAQLGGGLFGGRAEELERLAMTELGQRYAIEDVDRIERLRQQAIQNAMGVSGVEQQARQQALANAFAMQQQYANMAQPYLNILYPQAGAVGQVQTSPFQFQGVTPSADAYYGALANIAGQNAYAIPGRESPAWQLGGQLAGAGAGLAGSAMIATAI